MVVWVGYTRAWTLTFFLFSRSSRTHMITTPPSTSCWWTSGDTGRGTPSEGGPPPSQSSQGGHGHLLLRKCASLLLLLYYYYYYYSGWCPVLMSSRVWGWGQLARVSGRHRRRPEVIILNTRDKSWYPWPFNRSQPLNPKGIIMNIQGDYDLLYTLKNLRLVSECWSTALYG